MDRNPKPVERHGTELTLPPTVGEQFDLRASIAGVGGFCEGMHRVDQPPKEFDERMQELAQSTTEIVEAFAAAEFNRGERLLDQAVSAYLERVPDQEYLIDQAAALTYISARYYADERTLPLRPFYESSVIQRAAYRPIAGSAYALLLREEGRERDLAYFMPSFPQPDRGLLVQLMERRK